MPGDNYLGSVSDTSGDKMPGEKRKLSKYTKRLKAILKLNEHATASDSVPASTLASQNSQASSAAAEELRKEFKSSIDALDIESVSNFEDYREEHRKRLEMATEKYSNSIVNEETAKPWTCSPEAARLVWTALCCSRDANGKGDLEHTGGLFFERTMQVVFEQTLKPSPLGTRKRVVICTDRVSGTLFVAVRGSKAWFDHVVNTASRTEHDSCGVRELAGSHGGYLSCMKELIPSFQKIFEKDVQTNPNIRHVVFTGSSSGGAVASLLFFYFAAQCSEVLGSAKRSLITFGSPPVTLQNLSTRAEGLPQVQSVLAFVNEGDVISRLSLDYVKSVAHLYERHVKETLQKQQRGGFAAGESELVANPVTPAQEWKLPDPSYYQIGRIVLLRPSLVDKDSTSPGCSELEYSDFSRLLWYDTVVHKGRTYTKRVGALVRSIDPDILPPLTPLEDDTNVQRQ